MRTFTINYARLTSTPQTSFDLTTGTGAIAVTYTVGSRTDAVTNPDGSVLGPLFTDIPACTLSGTVTIPLGPTDTAAAKMRELIGTICATEGLDPAQGDHVLDSGGSVLA